MYFYGGTEQQASGLGKVLLIGRIDGSRPTGFISASHGIKALQPRMVLVVY